MHYQLNSIHSACVYMRHSLHIILLCYVNPIHAVTYMLPDVVYMCRRIDYFQCTFVNTIDIIIFIWMCLIHLECSHCFTMQHKTWSIDKLYVLQTTEEEFCVLKSQSVCLCIYVWHGPWCSSFVYCVHVEVLFNIMEEIKVLKYVRELFFLKHVVTHI